MSRLIDVSGEKFGYLTVVERDLNQTSSGTYWKCICKCNTPVSVEASRLKSGKTKSCGCFRSEVSKSRGEDLSGKSFGILTVIRRSEEKSEGGHYLWICKCECGIIKGIRACHLKAEPQLAVVVLIIKKDKKEKAILLI